MIMCTNRSWLRPILTLVVAAFCFVALDVVGITEAFVLPQHAQQQHYRSNVHTINKKNVPSTTTTPSSSKSQLHVLLDLPEGFFTVTFPMLGILLGWSRGFSRLRMEERAWELRLEESRQQKLAADPTLTEIELRRKEASMEWSAYGKPRLEEEQLNREREQRIKELENEISEGAFGRERRGRGRRGTKVMDYYDDEDDHEEVSSSSRRSGSGSNRMTDDEIRMFEMEHGIDYDPYYDDPYTEEELPDDMNYQIDKKYGDRVYENGEVFYKDKASGMYYRQGAKPRNLSFW